MQPHCSGRLSRVSAADAGPSGWRGCHRRKQRRQRMPQRRQRMPQRTPQSQGRRAWWEKEMEACNRQSESRMPRWSKPTGALSSRSRGVHSLWSLRQKLDSPRQADRRLGQSNAQKRLFDRPGLSTFWRNDNIRCWSVHGRNHVPIEGSNRSRKTRIQRTVYPNI